MFKDKTILITGGTGSCGRSLIKRLIPYNPKEIRIFSRDEKKQYDVRHEFADCKNIRFMIGNIKDKDRITEATKNIDLIFHTAALKHVNICEVNAFEAVKTNIIGTQNVIEAAILNKVDKVISLSSDKAVKPVNAMGMTKALQEKLIIQANFSPSNGGTKFSCVRYGNVMESRGSVMPFFRNLLKKGKTLTITHPEMTRFMLTLGDSINLIFFATEHMKGGEIFVKKAPSTRIIDIAKVLAEEAGNELDYKIIGTFPGEKIHEILISEEEMARAEDKDSFFIIHSFKPSAHLKGPYNEYCSKDDLISKEDIKKLLKKADKEKDGYSEEKLFTK